MQIKKEIYRCSILFSRLGTSQKERSAEYGRIHAEKSVISEGSEPNG